MPFDGTELSPITQTLIEGRRRIEAGWCQGVARTRGRVCAIGAISSDSNFEDTLPFLIAAIEVPNGLHIGDWNDKPHRTQADVIAAYDRAIALSLSL